VRQVGIAGLLLLVLAGIVSGVGYALDLPRLVVLVGVVCLAIGVALAIWGAYVRARTDEQTIAQSLGRSIKETLRLVLDLVP
jgi:hypothetical protein